MYSLEDYLKQFKAVFIEDNAFSQKFKRQIDKIILSNLIEIHDHETQPTEQDRTNDINGFDRTITLPITPLGRRIRRNQWLKKADFTVDLKEWTKPTKPNYYIYGYANDQETELVFYMFWNYKEFVRLVKEGKIHNGNEKNRNHSTVPFLTFPLKEIFDKCHVLDFGGTPEAIRQVLGNNPSKNSKLGEFA